MAQETKLKKMFWFLGHTIVNFKFSQKRKKLYAVLDLSCICGTIT